MKSQLLVLIALIAAIFFGVFLSEPTYDGPIKWRTDLEAARKDAQASGRPMLIVFR